MTEREYSQEEVIQMQKDRVLDGLNAVNPVSAQEFDELMQRTFQKPKERIKIIFKLLTYEPTDPRFVDGALKCFANLVMFYNMGIWKP